MDEARHLHILWTTGDPDTALGLAITYAYKSVTRGWWDQVTVILWGASERLAAGDTRIQEAMKGAMAAGVRFAACVAYANDLGVADQLTALGVDVSRQGPALTELLQSGRKLLTV